MPNPAKKEIDIVTDTNNKTSLAEAPPRESACFVATKLKLYVTNQSEIYLVVFADCRAISAKLLVHPVAIYSVAASANVGHK